MPSATEGLGAKTPLGAALADGVETLSLNQTVRFTRYIKLILPLDGYVFWVRADLVSTSALMNAARFNSAFFNEPLRPISAAPFLDAKGSMHYSTDTIQAEDESYALNRMVFTSLGPIDDFNEVSPMVAYIGEFEGVRVVFSQRASFYQQADLYHYRGDAIYPVMETQIIDDPAALDTSNVIVSNSLPVWLTLNQFMPMYPSFLVPDNLAPPYASVHILPEGTRALQSAPFIDGNGSHFQLVADRVRVTLYGMRNFNALDWVDYVNRYSVDYDVLGIMNMPVIRDEKKNQNELGIIAQKKTIEFEVSYYQSRIQAISRQYILSCIPTFNVVGYQPPPNVPWDFSDLGTDVLLDWFAQDISGEVQAWPERINGTVATQPTQSKRPVATNGEVRFVGSPQNLIVPNISNAFQYHRWAFMLFRVRWSTLGGADGTFAYINGNSGSVAQRQPLLGYIRAGSKVEAQWRDSIGSNSLQLDASGDDVWHTLVTRRVGGVHYASVDGGPESRTGAGITLTNNGSTTGLIGDFRTSFMEWGLDRLVYGQSDLTDDSVARMHAWGAWRRGTV